MKKNSKEVSYRSHGGIQLIFGVSLFLLYHACGSPRWTSYSGPPIPEYTLDEVIDNCQAFSNDTIFVTDFYLAYGFYLHSRGVYYARSPKTGTQLLVLTSHPLPVYFPMPLQMLCKTKLLFDSSSGCLLILREIRLFLNKELEPDSEDESDLPRLASSFEKKIQ